MVQFLKDIYYNGTKTCYVDPDLEYLQNLIFWITLQEEINYPRACLKIHSRRLHAPLRGIFGPDSVSVARYASIIGTKSPTKWDAQPTESNFQTRSSTNPRYAGRNLAYCRHVEAIYCTRENVSFTIGTVCDRCNNHKGPRPDLYVLPDCPSIYHY